MVSAVRFTGIQREENSFRRQFMKDGAFELIFTSSTSKYQLRLFVFQALCKIWKGKMRLKKQAFVYFFPFVFLAQGDILVKILLHEMSDI